MMTTVMNKPIQPAPLPLAVCSRWAALTVRDRARVMGRLPGQLIDHADALVEAVGRPFGRRATDTLGGEVIPLADAAKYLSRNAERLLRPRRLGRRGRPMWLMGVDASIHFEPHGLIAVIGPGNYPLMLPGIHTLQALVAGNSVAVKPAPGGGEAMRLLARLLHDAGVPDDALCVLDESVEAAQRAIDQADKVIFTGSETTGRAVMRQLAANLTPTVMELGGCDAVFVMAGADLRRVTDCMVFGLTFNGSATCIAPRRVFVHRSLHDDLAERLEARRCGAVIHTHVRADDLPHDDTLMPVLYLVPVDSMEEALAADARCGLHLGASIFGPAGEAAQLASRVNAGSICINDIIAPTADPRLPFAGRGRSGFGSTRGEQGLYEMVRLKAISHRRGGLTAHLDEPVEQTGDMLRAILAAHHHPSVLGRLRAWWRIVTLGRAITRQSQSSIQPSNHSSDPSA